jgi:hypothetical protein
LRFASAKAGRLTKELHKKSTVMGPLESYAPAGCAKRFCIQLNTNDPFASNQN